MKVFRIAYPSLVMGGGEVRSYNVLKFLSKRAEITLVPHALTICGKNEETVEETVKWASKLNIYVPEANHFKVFPMAHRNALDDL